MAYHKYTESEIEYIKANYADMYNSQIAEHLGLTANNVKNFAQRNGLKKSEKFFAGYSLNNIGGWNKGLKMKDQTKEKLKHTWFQKGQKPKHTKPIGSERYSQRDGWYIKIGEPKVWIPKGRYLWLQAYGEIPEGFKVVYKDKDHKNCVLENLELIADGNLLMKNSNNQLLPNDVLKVNKMVKKLKKLIAKNEQI